MVSQLENSTQKPPLRATRTIELNLETQSGEAIFSMVRLLRSFFVRIDVNFQHLFLLLNKY